MKIINNSRIAIYCGGESEIWEPDDSITKGLGGAEEAVVYLSHELVKLGWKVDIYSHCTKPGNYDGVNYFKYDFWHKELTYDIFIAWRIVEYIDLAPKSALKYLWLHDVQNSWQHIEERILNIDKIFVLSEWHRNNLKEIQDDKFFITRNGIVSSDFSMAGILPRDNYKCIYASSPYRGLDTLLKLWPKIKDDIKDASLHIFYGFSDIWDNLHAEQYKERTLKLISELDGVYYHGKVNHENLNTHLMSSGLWLYPTHFSETSCITAMKAQAAGAIPITVTTAALDETVQFGYKISSPIANEMSKIEFINKTRELLLGSKKQEEKRMEMISWAQNFYDWKNVASEWSLLFNETLNKKNK